MGIVALVRRFVASNKLFSVFNLQYNKAAVSERLRSEDGSPAARAVNQKAGCRKPVCLNYQR